MIRATLLIALAALIGGCGDAAPLVTSLSALSESQKDFDGRHVIVSGTLRTYAVPRHYWIENEALDRVAVEGDQDFSALVGETIEVSGKFTYGPDQGRLIQVEEFNPLP